MKKGLTELVMILDRSGSMSGLEADTICGFNGMIEKKKEEEKWEFLFFGANIDAVKEAGRFGIRPSRAVTYEHDRRGTSLNYEVMSRTVSCARAAESQAEFGAFLDEDELMAPIREDYRRRHGKN